MLMFSCDKYETKVKNVVHKDGSVTRTVEMKKTSKEDFNPEEYLVPVDSTWKIEYSLEIGEAADTTWILSAEKEFESVDQINAEYKADSGDNKSLKRHAEFHKKYRWFYTEYRYEEIVESIMDLDLEPDSFMSPEEIKCFYLPQSIAKNIKSGSDSLKYKELDELIEKNMEAWFWSALVKQWVLNLHSLASENSNYSLSLPELQSNEEQFLFYLEKYADQDDYLPDSVVKFVMGQDFIDDFDVEIDSAFMMLESSFETYMDANHYELEVCMPGKLTESNGYIITNEELTENRNLLWSVSADYYFTQDYIMWAESRINNIYAWIISAVFVFFTALGLLRRKRKN